jgi:hypothetical protein
MPVASVVSVCKIFAFSGRSDTGVLTVRHGEKSGERREIAGNHDAQ